MHADDSQACIVQPMIIKGLVEAGAGMVKA